MNTPTPLIIGCLCVGSIVGSRLYRVTFASDALIPAISFVPCTGYNSELSPPLSITEIGFDGSDERIEITNTSMSDYAGELRISGAKSSVISMPFVFISSGTSILVGDQGGVFSGSLSITGLGLSIPDTTGFTLSLLSSSGVLFDTLDMPYAVMRNSPNNQSLHAVLVDYERLWEFVTGSLSTIPLPGAANPTIFFCAFSVETEPPLVDSGALFQEIDGEGDYVPEQTQTISTGGVIHVMSGASGGTIILTSGDSTAIQGNSSSDSQMHGYFATGSSVLSVESGDVTTGDAIGIVSGDITGNMLASGEGVMYSTGNFTGAQASSVLLPHPCAITEIHSLNDTYPEYVEMFCVGNFSGEVIFVGLGAGDAIKSLSMYTTGMQTHIVTAFPGYFSDGGERVVHVVSGISLRDDGEGLVFGSSGYVPRTYAYPSVSKGNSYYPECLDPLAACMVIAPTSPGYVFLTPIPAPASLPPVVQSLASSGSALVDTYQSLYATIPLASLSQQSSTAPVSASGSQSFAPKTTKKTTTTKTSAKAAIKKSPKTVAAPTATSTKKSPSPTQKSVIKPQNKAKSVSATSSSVAKVSSSAGKVSTSSKAYQTLVREHAVYKAYTTFVDQYISSHLYQQYTALSFPQIKKLLTTSLSHIKKNPHRYLGTGANAILESDFSVLWGKSLGTGVVSMGVFRRGDAGKSTLVSLANLLLENRCTKCIVMMYPPRIRRTMYNPHIGKVYKKSQYSLGFSLSSHSGNLQSQFDTGNDIIDIKTLATNFLSLE